MLSFFIVESFIIVLSFAALIRAARDRRRVFDAGAAVELPLDVLMSLLALPVVPVPNSLAAKPTLNAASTAAALLATPSRFAQTEIALRVGPSSDPVT